MLKNSYYKNEMIQARCLFDNIFHSFYFFAYIKDLNYFKSKVLKNNNFGKSFNYNILIFPFFDCVNRSRKIFNLLFLILNIQRKACVKLLNKTNKITKIFFVRESS